MAEIGLVGTIVGLAGAGVKLSLTLYTFSETASSAGSDIKNIARDVSLTSSVLKELGTNLEQDDQTKLYSSSALQTAKEVVRECESVFIDLEKVMQKAMERTSKKASKPGKLTLSAFDKLKWPFLQPKMEVLRSNLERLKSTLVLMLNVLAYAKDLRAEKNSSTKDDGGYQKMLIENLIRANQEATRNYETLLKTLGARENTLSDGHSGTRDPEDGASIAGTTINMSSISDLEPPASTIPISNHNTPINLEQVPADEGSEVESTIRACLKRIEDTLLQFEQSDSAAASEPRIGVRIELEKEVSKPQPEAHGPPKPWVVLSIVRKDAPPPLKTPSIALQADIDDTIAVMHENIRKVSQRGERLDSLQDKTDNLAVSAQGFRRGANRVRKQNSWNVKNWVYTAGAAVASVPELVSKATQGFFADEDEAFEDPGTLLEYHENLNVGSSSPRPPSRSPTFDDILQPAAPGAAANLANQPGVIGLTLPISIDSTEGGMIAKGSRVENLEERKKSEARLAELKLDMEEALQEKDLRWQEEIRKSRAKFEVDIAKGVAETAELKTNIQKMTEEKEAQFRAMQAEMEGRWGLFASEPGEVQRDHGIVEEDNKVDYFVMDPSEESHQPDREIVEERNGVDQLLREWTTLYNDSPTLAATTPDEQK